MHLTLYKSKHKQNLTYTLTISTCYKSTVTLLLSKRYYPSMGLLQNVCKLKKLAKIPFLHITCSKLQYQYISIHTLTISTCVKATASLFLFKRHYPSLGLLAENMQTKKNQPKKSNFASNLFKAAVLIYFYSYFNNINLL